MDEPRPTRLIETALQCYPARWRRRHGDEAAELAVLLIIDGTPPASIAVSYLAGAAREWLTPRPSRRMITVACALLAAACSLAAAAGLLTSAVPARAANTSHWHGRGHCRPASPEPVPGVIAAMGHSHVITREAGHDRSC